jgi:hypothetical protein
MAIAVVFMSYTLAKTLHERLGKVIADFERTSQREIVSLDEANRAIEMMLQEETGP